MILRKVCVALAAIGVVTASAAAELKAGDTVVYYTDSKISDRSPVKIDRLLGSYMRIAGISGIRVQRLTGQGTGADSLAAFEKSALATKPALIFLYHGYGPIQNKDSLDSLRPTMLAMIDAAQAAGARVKLLTHIPHVNTRYTAQNGAILKWNDQIRAIAKQKKCGLVDLYQITLDKLNRLFPEKPGNFGPAFDYRQYTVSVLGGMIQNRALIKEMGFQKADEATLLAAIDASHPKGYTIRYGEAYRATLDLDSYRSLRDLSMPQKEAVVARCNDELVKMIAAAYDERQKELGLR